jgi:hypothetical protein
MQLGLAHRALEPQHEPVVEVPRMVDAVRVGDQRVGHGAQIEQLIPIGVVPSQPRHLQAEHDPDLAQPDVRDQLLEPRPPGRVRARPTQISVDHHHLMRRPAQRHRSFPQLVLPGQALGMRHHLRRGGLTHIHARVPTPMRGGHLARRQQQRRCRRPPPARVAHSSSPRPEPTLADCAVGASPLVGAPTSTPRAIIRASRTITSARTASGSRHQPGPAVAAIGSAPIPRSRTVCWAGATLNRRT